MVRDALEEAQRRRGDRFIYGTQFDNGPIYLVPEEKAHGADGKFLTEEQCIDAGLPTVAPSQVPETVIVLNYVSDWRDGDGYDSVKMGGKSLIKAKRGMLAKLSAGTG